MQRLFDASIYLKKSMPHSLCNSIKTAKKCQNLSTKQKILTELSKRAETSVVLKPCSSQNNIFSRIPKPN